MEIYQGQSFPLGATVFGDGVNFSLYSKNAERVELLLFDAKDHQSPFQVIELDPHRNRTYQYWHVYVKGARHGLVYAYRVHGPFDPATGHRFDGSKVLLDPYARAIVSDRYERAAAIGSDDNCAKAMKSVVIDTNLYDWEGDRPLNHEFANSIIYELHVGGFTKHASSGLPDRLRGTYRGLIEKIPYLKKLGITCVELMPVQQYDPEDLPDQSLSNYWGYSPIAFFAPHNGYASDPAPAEVLDEFRDMVKALHRENIAVVLDVVFNHTAEGDEVGPTLSFKGIENRAYYLLEEDPRHYLDYSGTGNSVRASHSVVRRMIRDCLRYWVSEMHVDGFRFDLASVLARDEYGNRMSHPPILWSIDSDPVLASSNIIAESWDIQMYQLGSFPGDRWAEWNGRFRDDVRQFVKGGQGIVRSFSQRLTASNDVFGRIFGDPNHSINFVSCHDGFTLNDLVSYNYKHNLANGEDNRDGTDNNHSWNCGVEGPTDDPEIEALRLQQIKNFLAILLISQGTPMLLMGDEVRRTQHGNNNAYCQDNEISWFDWTLAEKHKDLLEFVRKLLYFNRSTPFFQEKVFWLAPEPHSSTKVEFHGIHLGQPDWQHHSHSLAFTLRNDVFGLKMHVVVNAFHEGLTFELPTDNAGPWQRIIDTSLAAPQDLQLPDTAPPVEEKHYHVKARSVVVLQSQDHNR